jgi:hypothetical protein
MIEIYQPGLKRKLMFQINIHMPIPPSAMIAGNTHEIPVCASRRSVDTALDTIQPLPKAA